MISSPAAAYLPYAYFTIGYFASSGTTNRIPVVGHEATEYELEPEESDEYGPYTPVRVVVDPPGDEIIEKIRGMVRGMERLPFPDEDNHPQEIQVAQSSVLDELRRVAHTLTRALITSCPWQDTQATWFVLTGEPPAVPAMRGRARAGRRSAPDFGTITLDRQSWVSADAVRKFYKRLQRRLLASKPGSTSERNLAVFRFVVSQLEVQAPDDSRRKPLLLSKRKATLAQPPWRTLLDRWNRKYPEEHEWHCKDVRNFSKAFRRAEQAVLPSHYKRRT